MVTSPAIDTAVRRLHRIDAGSTSVRGTLGHVGGTIVKALRDPRSVTRGEAALLLALLMLACGAMAAAILESSSLNAMFTSIVQGKLGRLRTELRHDGLWAVTAVAVLVLAHTVVPFPAELVTAAAGFALGFAVALPLLLALFVVSALIAYLVGSLAGRPAAERIVGAERARRAERLVDRGGSRALLALRLFPLIPFSPVCLACGMAHVPVRRYAWTTALGMLPELALVTLLGTRLDSSLASDPVVWGAVVGILILIIGGSRLLRTAVPAR